MQKSDLYKKIFPPVHNILFPISWLGCYMWQRVFGSSSSTIATLVLDGILFGEGPRIHQEQLVFSDMYKKQVVYVDIETNKVVKRLDFPDNPSGLGWLPDGRMLVVAMKTLKLMVVDDQDGIAEYADLSQYAQYRANDMVVDQTGNAYVGNFGFDFTQYFDTCTTPVARVDTNGKAHVGAPDMFFPNGSVFTPDGKTLIIAETFHTALTAFDVAEDGSLSNRRVWANVGMPVDGICLDAEGCIWACLPQVGAYKTHGCVVRIRERGEIVECFGFGQNGLYGSPVACNLATTKSGEHVLYVLEADVIEEAAVFRRGPSNARVKALKVHVGPAIRPKDERYNGGYC